VTTFFVSDHHWGHANIIRHASRPFTSAEEMDEEMITRWNQVVGNKDTVYHLGDVGLCSPDRLRPILDRLKGNIHLVPGNHDKSALKPECRSRFASVTPLLDIHVPDPDASRGTQLIVLCHYGMRTWNKRHHGSWHLYGHSHGKLPPHGLSFDVSVDCHNFTPISYDQVKAKMATLDGTPEHQLRGDN
jgi:calcineurin-like phosphoesterase family protein